ncbi:MAG: hypothetical protein R3Y24_09480 [Eubacteriales bacterium]
MDKLMGKIVQRLNSTELMKANTSIELKENKKLKIQISEYQACIGELRSIAAKNIMTAAQLSKIAELSCQKMEEVSDECLKRVQQIEEASGECLKRAQQIEVPMKQVETQSETELKELLAFLQKSIVENQEKIEELFGTMEDHVHKENVKVYRNVQAVVQEESAILKDKQLEKKGEKAKGSMIMLLLILISILANLGIQISQILGLL